MDKFQNILFTALVVTLSITTAENIDAQTFDQEISRLITNTEHRLQTAGLPAATRRFDLSLDDAIERALDRNLDIAVQRINPLVQDLGIASANAAFLPLFQTGFGVNRATTPARTQLDGGRLGGSSTVITDRGNYDLGINQQLKWGGGQYNVSLLYTSPSPRDNREWRMQ